MNSKKQNNKKSVQTTTKTVRSNGGKQTTTRTVQRQPNPRPGVKQPPMMPHLGGCAKDYARCLMNPFSGPIACIPDFPVLLTRKVRVWSRGTFTCSGATGFGSICVTPENACANDSPCGFITGAAYAGNVIPTNSATPGVTAITSNSDYAISDFGAAAGNTQRRVVSSGLRVRYNGTELNRGGQIFALQEPTHDSLDAKDQTFIMSVSEGKKFPVVNRNWTTVLYRPIDTSVFKNAVPTAATSQPAATFPGSNYMAMIVQSPSSAPGSFEYEFYTVLEFTGRNVRGSTSSAWDPVGFSAVHTVAQLGTHRVAHQEADHVKENAFLDEVGKWLVNGLTWVGNNAGTIMEVGSIVASLL